MIYIVNPSLLELITMMQVLTTLWWNKTLHFVWTRKISNQLHMGIIAHGGIGTATTTGSKLSGASGKYRIHNVIFYVKLPLYFNLYCNKDNAGTHRFGMDQNSPIILNEDNTEPTTDGSHSHGGLLTGTTIQSSLPLDSGNYQIQTSWQEKS
jgi:hypothetical protein